MEMKKKLVIAGIVAVAALFILSLSDRNFLYPALVGAMVLMHLGMYGMHGKHGDENMGIKKIRCAFHEFMFCSIKCRNVFSGMMELSDEREKKELMKKDIVI